MHKPRRPKNLGVADNAGPLLAFQDPEGSLIRSLGFLVQPQLHHPREGGGAAPPQYGMQIA